MRPFLLLLLFLLPFGSQAQFQGGVGRGDVTHGIQGLTFMFQGGSGRGDVAYSVQNPIRITDVQGLSTFCQGDNFLVEYMPLGTFNAGNTFKVDLSNEVGSFTGSSVIGTLTTTGSGSVFCIIPAGLSAGTGYRLRVRSTSPPRTGFDYPVDLTVLSLTTWFFDADGDGFGNPASTAQTCFQPNGYVANNTDNCPNIPGLIGNACDDGNVTTTNDVITAACVCAGTVPNLVRVAARVFLEGPFVPTLVQMGDGMRALGLVPTVEPYTGIGYTHVGGGGETTVPAVLAMINENAIVDWVVLELRSSSSSTTVLATRSALVQRDGDVVDVDGTSPVSLTIAPGSYFVAVRHRNHLGCMTASGVSLSASALSVDFTSSALATFGTNARKTSTGAVPVQLLWAGDVTFNGEVKYTGSGNDRDPILTTVGSTTPNNTVSIYSTRDVNLNGQVKYTGSANDRDPILVNVGSTTPNNVRVQQLP